MVAPIGIGCALRYRLSPVLVGLMIVNGAGAGSFSPIGIFGSITNNVVERNGLPRSPATLFVVCLLLNLLLGAVVVAPCSAAGTALGAPAAARLRRRRAQPTEEPAVARSIVTAP